MMRTSCPLFFLIALCALSCTSPEEQIIGYWKFDHVERPDVTEPVELQALTNMNSNLTYVHLLFNENGSCVFQLEMDAIEHEGTYKLIDDGRKILLTRDDTGEEKSISIKSISGDELEVGDDIIYMVLIKQ